MEELSLKEVQQGSLHVLKKIKQICEEQNIKYWLAYGTLLGAVRHHGFIPWDDDIDIMMPRDDFERFVQYCIDHESELGYFKLKHYRTCKEYIYGVARFCDTRYKIDYTNAKDYGLGLFVDIYPMDGVNPDDKRHIKKVEHTRRAILDYGYKKFVKSKSLLRTIIKIPYFAYSRLINCNKKLEKLDRLSQKYKYSESKYVTCVDWYIDLQIFERTDFEEQVLLPFEDTMISCPKNYDNILKTCYGDYMKLPPESERVAHHYYTAYKL